MARVSGAGLLQPAGDQRVGERRLPDLGDPQPGRPHLDGGARTSSSRHLSRRPREHDRGTLDRQRSPRVPGPDADHRRTALAAGPWWP